MTKSREHREDLISIRELLGIEEHFVPLHSIPNSHYIGDLQSSKGRVSFGSFSLKIGKGKIRIY